MNIDNVTNQYYKHCYGSCDGLPLGRWFMRYLSIGDKPSIEGLDIMNELDFNKARVKIAQYLMNREDK